MAHGNKTMPLDRYPYMDNDLKSKVGDFVTHEELNSILNDYVSNDSLNSALTNYVTKNNIEEMLRFKWITLSTKGLEGLILEPTTEAEWATNSQIFYNFFKSNIEERSFKTYKFQKDLAKLFIRDVVDHVCLIVFRPNDTRIFGFGKNDQTGMSAPSLVGDTNYLYYFTTDENNIIPGYRILRPTRIWGNNYTPTE